MKLLYVMGMLRSGTTLLSASLASQSEVENLGETVVLWQAAEEGRICTCQRPVTECDFWGPVLQQVLETFPRVGGFRGIHGLATRSVRVRQTAVLMRQVRSNQVDSEVRTYAEVLGVVYRTAAATSGAKALVDASKSPAVAAILPLIPDITPTYVHIHRDPRAVARSEGSTSARWGEVDQSLLPPTRQPARSGLAWLAYNLAAEYALRQTREEVASVSIRYEDFVRQPGTTLDVIARTAGMRTGGWPLEAPTVLQLRPSHEAAGNPNRFESRRREFRLDTSWSRDMSARDWWTVTSVAGPLLSRYGYPLRQPRA